MWSAQTDPFANTASGGCPETVLLKGEGRGHTGESSDPASYPAVSRPDHWCDACRHRSARAFTAVCVRRCSAL